MLAPGSAAGVRAGGAAPWRAGGSAGRPDGVGPEGEVRDGDLPEGDLPEGDTPEGGGLKGDGPEGDLPEGDVPEGGGLEGDGPEGGGLEGEGPEGGGLASDGLGWEPLCQVRRRISWVGFSLVCSCRWEALVSRSSSCRAVGRLCGSLIRAASTSGCSESGTVLMSASPYMIW
jgi:hypothetical protein